MSDFHGYHQRVLRIDVSTGHSARVPLEERVLRRYLGGSGLGVHLLLESNTAALDALDPAAPLAIVFSPLVGSPLTTSAKFAVVSKSPLTGRINDSLASSQFALSGKRGGCDALLLVGRAREPVIVVVDDGHVRVEPAGTLWGMSAPETEARLRDRLGSSYRGAVIGPAGQRLVRYATISHDGRHAGRGGSGAVMGAKNIKAIMVRGTRTSSWAQPRALAEYARLIAARAAGPATAKYRELGTAANLTVFNRLAALPTRNFQHGTFPEAAVLAPEPLNGAGRGTREACAACTIGCEHRYQLGGAPHDASRSVRVEYENLFALGPLCGVGDRDTVLEASRACDDLGIDTISTGGTIAFAMECAERGILDAPWLRFGSGDALLRAIDLIGRRDGLGDLMAEGSRAMARRIGGRAPELAHHVKGMEIPGYEPRALQTMALGFAVGTRGADHNRSSAYEVDFSEAVDRRCVGPEAAILAVRSEDRAVLMDSLILCKFLRGVFEDLFADAAYMLQLVTGWDTTAEELRMTAHRIVTAKKQYNILAGWRPSEDTLPPRLLRDALPEDSRARLRPQRLHALVQAYNRVRGWSPEGWIPVEELQRLDVATP